MWIILNGGRDRNRTDVQGFAVLCMTTLPLGQKNKGKGKTFPFKKFKQIASQTLRNGS